MNPQEILGILLLCKNRELLTIKLCFLINPGAVWKYSIQNPKLHNRKQQQENDLSAWAEIPVRFQKYRILFSNWQ